MSAPTNSARKGRIARRFAALRAARRGGFIAFVTAGDPDPTTSLEIVRGLPAAGADIIELGVPFSDPMADGPAIQASSLRALKAGASLKSTLALVRAFRQGDDETPIVLMGYYNPIDSFGVASFVGEASAAGVDGLIVVDLPPEEDDELRPQARGKGLDFIRLATPTTDDARLPRVLDGSSGFLYYVSITGVTGTAAASESEVGAAIARFRRRTDLPIAAGFGIRTPEQAARIAAVADAAVVGSALVDIVAKGLETAGGRDGLVAAVLGEAARLATAAHGAWRGGNAPRPAAQE